MLIILLARKISLPTFSATPAPKWSVHIFFPSEYNNLQFAFAPTSYAASFLTPGVTLQEVSYSNNATSGLMELTNPQASQVSLSGTACVMIGNRLSCVLPDNLVMSAGAKYWEVKVTGVRGASSAVDTGRFNVVIHSGDYTDRKSVV